MKVSFYTLGCRVNQYETEMLKERFRAAGYETVAEEEFADVYVINTCTVTSLADRKSRQYIRRMKRKNPASFICVTGCYAQISPEEVAAIEGVDLVVGTSDKGRIPELVASRLGECSAEDGSKVKSTETQGCDLGVFDNVNSDSNILVRAHNPGEEYIETGVVESMEGRTRAFIKVQEGCNRYCSYCEIPFARGDVRSRQPMKVLEEAKMLIGKGFKEIVLTGINTALYGTEKHFKPNFEVAENDNNDENNIEDPQKYQKLWQESCGDDGVCKYGTGLELLIAMISDIPGDFRIRISSLEPTVVRAEDVMRLLKYEKLCHHFHLSMQSGSNNVLKAMNRRYEREEYIKIAKALYEFDPCFGISTDIIAGFPGESESDFADSIGITEEIPFCKVHAFDYSKRPGTKAAEMKGHLDPQVKKRRVKELIAAGDAAQKRFFEKCAGTERVVLIEEYLPEIGMYVGYTDNFVRAYIPAAEMGTGREEVNIINNFVTARLERNYRDGMTATPTE
ncbi:MAG: MiaB/RimO family radical SAM methylthiotransferase [Firmicutes bacterium]|nr:MiaB/RimO family radical SAM methylthiotransferase [Bacillota bacterium]